MSGLSIGSDVAQALQEAAREVGDGQRATLLRPSPQPANPWDAPALARAPQQLWVVTESYGRDMIDGTLIRAEDRRAMIEAVFPPPTTADRLVLGGVEYGIVRVEPEAPAGVALYYVAQCRR